MVNMIKKSKIKLTPEELKFKATGYDEYKKGYLTRMIYGFFMGISDGIPGYSGGTTLTLLGFYEKLIFKIKEIFTDFKNAWWKNILWLLPFLIFTGIALLGFSLVTNWIAEAGFQYLLILIFGLFTFLCIPSFILVNKPNLIKIKYGTLFIAKKNNISIILFVVGFLIILAIGLFIYFNGGIQLEGNIVEPIAPGVEWITLSLSMALAGFVALIPGISGSMTLFLTGVYDDIYFGALNNIFENIPLLILLTISAGIGIIINVLITSFILKRWKEYYISFSFGMVVASFITILLAGKFYLEGIGPISVAEIFLIILTLIIVVLINVFLFLISMNQTKQNDIFQIKNNPIKTSSTKSTTQLIKSNKLIT